MPQLTKIDWKSLWGILWRVLLLAPVLWVLGLALLVIVLGAFVVPPFYAVFLICAGHWLVSGIVIIGWLFLLGFRTPILRWTLDGFEYSDI